MLWINLDVFLFLFSRMKRVYYNANANEVIVDQNAKIWKAVRFVDSLKHILLFKFFSIEHIGMNYTSYVNFLKFQVNLIHGLQDPLWFQSR